MKRHCMYVNGQWVESHRQTWLPVYDPSTEEIIEHAESAAEIVGHQPSPDELLRRTEEAERVGREHDVPLLSEVLAKISRGIANVRAEQYQEGVEDLQQSLARLAKTGQQCDQSRLTAS